MKKLLSAVTLFLMSSWAYAAMSAAEEVISVPSEPVDMVYVVLFLILFFGLIAGFFVYMWMKERKKPRDQ